jgi:hypothetical protein
MINTGKFLAGAVVLVNQRVKTRSGQAHLSGRIGVVASNQLKLGKCSLLLLEKGTDLKLISPENLADFIECSLIVLVSELCLDISQKGLVCSSDVILALAATADKNKFTSNAVTDRSAKPKPLCTSNRVNIPPKQLEEKFELSEPSKKVAKLNDTTKKAAKKAIERDDAVKRDAIKAAAEKWTEAHSAALDELKSNLIGEGFDINKPIKVSDERSEYEFFQGLKGLTSVETISLFIRLTARTAKQEVVARCLLATDFDRLSKYNECHALHIHVAIKFASGDLTINLAQRHLKDLDRLQRVIAEERAWYFNHGDLPDPKFTMILNGSYCPDDENPAEFDMRNLKFTNEFVEQISIDNDLDITNEQIERIVSEIMVSDKVEVCYPTHHEESARQWQVW